jgi:dimethylhistidine N-methyltransferase
VSAARPRVAARVARPPAASGGALSPAAERLAAEVAAGLSAPGQKRLPSSLLYDELGSALFEAICALPEYGLTRADERLLRRNARQVVDALPSPLWVAELGSGSGRKTRWVLEALALREESAYFPIDLSAAALDRCAGELGRMPAMRVEPIEADYLDGLREVVARRQAPRRILVLFLGSTIGNFDPPAARDFLRELRRLLVPGDALLLGTDLVKPVPRLLAAYDDALGVTAAFDLNLLVRVNREFDADFDLGRFTHQARWDAEARRVEMHLVSRVAQAATVRELGLTIEFRAGESIWTESSHKYAAEDPVRLGEGAGFRPAGQWMDSEWPFAESLLVAR